MTVRRRPTALQAAAGVTGAGGVPMQDSTARQPGGPPTEVQFPATRTSSSRTADPAVG